MRNTNPYCLLLVLDATNLKKEKISASNDKDARIMQPGGAKNVIFPLAICVESSHQYPRKSLTGVRNACSHHALAVHLDPKAPSIEVPMKKGKNGSVLNVEAHN